MYFREMNLTTAEFGGNRVDTVIIPVGSFEQHSSHMCLGTDSLIATYISEDVAKQTNSICIFPIVYGVSGLHKSFSGTIYVEPKHLYLYIKDVIRSLSGTFIKNILLVNGHGGNWFAINKACEDLAELFNHIEVVQWWELIGNAFFSEPECSHAGAQELSVLAYINKDFVRLDKVSNQIKNMDIDITECKDLSEVTLNGVVGVAKTYDIEKGGTVSRKVVELLKNKIVEWKK